MGSTTIRQDDADALHEQAERWFARLAAPDCGSSERCACDAWRAADPRHEVAFREVERLFGMSAQLLADPALALALARARKPAATPVWRRAPAWLAVAASVLVAVTVAWPLLHTPPPQFERYATSVGEQRELLLSDGSQVLLDTDSVLTVRYDRRRRQVALERGRAQFDVAHDEHKPFVVAAANGNIRALGTQFQVTVEDAAATVLLLEGSVAVSAPAPQRGERAETLRPGEELSFDTRRGTWSRHRPDIAFARGWVNGDLVFDGRRLDELIGESNRYALTKLQLADPALGAIRVSGVFRAGNQRSLVLALEHGWQLHAVQASDGTLLLQRGRR